MRVRSHPIMSNRPNNNKGCDSPQHLILIHKIPFSVGETEQDKSNPHFNKVNLQNTNIACTGWMFPPVFK